VELQGISVRYRVPRERISGFKEYAIRWIQGRIEYVDFWALKDVSLSVAPGEIFGLMGPNGAGKTTLLKTVARVLDPTRGRVIVRGRLAPLLELGAGFHPELTGRENVFLYGTLLGHTRREMADMFGEIVDFAGLWDFIDSPLRVYSTGMASRLAFAVATCRRADVLLIDEALAVGDAAFQEKSLHRLEAFQSSGSAIVFVSHYAEAVRRLCARAAWLAQGELKRIGPADDVVDAYLAAGAGEEPAQDASSAPEGGPSLATREAMAG
jgi:ABC-type polysaccharide/polyol phosphate transport system ATPase subunit